MTYYCVEYSKTQVLNYHCIISPDFVIRSLGKAQLSNCSPPCGINKNRSSEFILFKAASHTRLVLWCKWIQLGFFACRVVSGPLHVITSTGWLNILHVSSGFQDTKMEPASLFKGQSQTQHRIFFSSLPKFKGKGNIPYPPWGGLSRNVWPSLILYFLLTCVPASNATITFQQPG